MKNLSGLNSNEDGDGKSSGSENNKFISFGELNMTKVSSLSASKKQSAKQINKINTQSEESDQSEYYMDKNELDNYKN